MLEDLYLPYKPKRRTKAMIARENGTRAARRGASSPTARTPPETLAAAYLTDEVADAKAALDGARDILTEQLGENADAARAPARLHAARGGHARPRGGGAGRERRQVLATISTTASAGRVSRRHRALAMLRAANEERADARHRRRTRDRPAAGRGDGRGSASALPGTRPATLADGDGALDLAGEARRCR